MGYYRAPELILGSQSYSTSVDIWSAGCVFGEMLLGQPLFTGKDGISQLVEIVKVMGTPSAEDLKAMNPDYPEHRFSPQLGKISWSLMFPRHANDSLTLEMIDGLLRFDPSKRATPIESLVHHYFDSPLRADRSMDFGPPLFN